MPTADQNPGKGVYTCKLCNQVIRMNDNSDELPSCPRCNSAEFNKINDLDTNATD